MHEQTADDAAEYLANRVNGLETQALVDEDLLMEAGATIDRQAHKIRNQRRELRRLNKLVHEHTSRAQSAGTKAQRRAIAVASLERQVKQLTQEVEDLRMLAAAMGVEIVRAY